MRETEKKEIQSNRLTEKEKRERERETDRQTDKKAEKERQTDRSKASYPT